MHKFNTEFISNPLSEKNLDGTLRFDGNYITNIKHYQDHLISTFYHKNILIGIIYKFYDDEIRA